MTSHSPDSLPPEARPPGDHNAAAADNVVILCTAPNLAVAGELADKVLEERLAACVTLLPGALSVYCWQGKIERQQEVQMLIKSHIRHQQALMALIKTHHPYQTPELLALPVLGGDQDYLSWLNASLR